MEQSAAPYLEFGHHLTLSTEKAKVVLYKPSLVHNYEKYETVTVCD